jgi:vibriolysin
VCSSVITARCGPASPDSAGDAGGLPASLQKAQNKRHALPRANEHRAHHGGLLMSKNVFRTALFLTLTSVGACAVADEPSNGKKDGEAEPAMQEVDVAAEGAVSVQAGNMEASAASYVASTLLSTNAADSFQVTNSGMSAKGTPKVRMAQYHQGVLVFGGDIVVHSNGGKFNSVRGTVMNGLEGFDVVPTLDKSSAMDSAKKLYLGKVTNRVDLLTYSNEKTQLVILPMEGAAPRLAWHVQFSTEYQGGVEPMQLNAFYDAHSGELLKRYNGIHTLSQASGPGGNAKVQRTWTAALDVEPSGSLFKMDTARLVTVNLNNGTSGGTIVTGSLANIGDAPINDAHGYAEAVLNMYSEWQGENSINENGFKIRSRVHYSSNYENAFWDGSQMTYGDGATRFYPLSGGLDVVAHEISHGFTTFHSNLTYSGQSGGMNESFSDIVGETAEAYLKQGAPDMLVGADIFKAATGALRYMCNPTQDGRSIDNLANFTSGIDVHLSSGIMNKAFCLTARRFATGSATGAVTMDSIKRASRAWFVANDDFWTAGSTFLAGCNGVLSAASSLGFTATEIGHITQSYRDVGVNCGTVTPPTTCNPTNNSNTTVTAIPDNNATGITSTINVPTGGSIASLSLSLNITHTYRGDLAVQLVSPQGTSFTVHNRTGGSADNLVISGQAITAFAGQSASGNWQLKVQDRASADLGNLVSWSVAIGRTCP